MSTLATRMFDGQLAESELENRLYKVGVCEYTHLGFDEYDNSLEIIGASDDMRLSAEAQKVLFDAGFSTVFVNHENEWETHYAIYKEGAFNPSDGWRVSYPHKRGEGGAILVEKHVDSWPADWYESGKVKIVTIPSAIPKQD